MTQATKEEITEIAQKLAQELNDLIAEGIIKEEQAEATTALLEEWESIYSRADLPWQMACLRDSKE